MRQIDRIECKAMGKSPKDALRLCLRTSLNAMTALDETGRPLAMFGVMPVSLVSGKGVPWFLGADDVFNYARQLLTAGPVLIGGFLDTFKRLDNVVAVENHRAINLLEHWGAIFEDRRETHGGVVFIPFRFERAIQAVPMAA